MSEPTENEIINALKNGGTWNGPTTYGQPLNITYSLVGWAHAVRAHAERMPRSTMVARNTATA